MRCEEGNVAMLDGGKGVGPKDSGGYTLGEIYEGLSRVPYKVQLERINAAHDLPQARARDPSVNDDMALDKQARPRVIDKVAEGCAFIAATLTAGGANLTGEIQWHDMMAIACHCAEPETTAHRLCQGSQHYNYDDTAMKLAEAQRAREANPGLGFTRCATLERNGAEAHCVTCKYQKYGKSPLNTPEANELPADGVEEDINYGRFPEVMGASGEYQPIPGGYYEASEENIERLNRRICRVVMGSDTLFYENMGLRGHQWRKPQAVEGAWAGAYISKTLEGNGAAEAVKSAAGKSIPLYKWYLDHPRKLPPALPVFKPSDQPGHIGDNEYNMWSGWSVQPDPNYSIVDPNSEVRIIISHIRDVLCRGERARFEYVMAWLAWKVQHPEEPCETVMVFRSGREGTGKNIVLDMYASLFGAHGVVFGDKRSVTGEHATNEYLALGVIDEALFHGDRQTTDQMKSMITGDTRVINPKFQDMRVVKNMGSFIILSNHDVVVTLGSHARRHVIFDVDERRLGDFAYFGRLKAAINNRGAGQFLHYLRNVSLKNWHPRRIVHTEETTFHQIAGMGATLKWLLDSSASGKLLGDMIGESKFFPYTVKDGSGGWKYETGAAVPLDHYVPTDTMFAQFHGWARSTRARDIDATNMVEFGRRMTKVLGPHTRLSVTKGSPAGSPQPGRAIKDRLWAYKLPDADDLRECVYKAWGIKQRKVS